MSFTNDVIAALALALVFPAVLFVTALVLRQVSPRESGPARSAERILTWYAAHAQLALWVLLFLFPLSAFVLGSAALLRTWGDNPRLQDVTWRALAAIPAHWPAMSIGGATLLAAAVMVMITAHLMREWQARPGAWQGRPTDAD
jgi:ABC-type Fe3+ transport system permease subunit